MPVPVYGISGVNDLDIETDIYAEYGETENASYARQVATIAGKWTANQPVGWRQNAKKREIRRSMRRYVSAKAREEIKPVGFVESVFFFWILGSIVSFIVQRLLARMFPENE